MSELYDVMIVGGGPAGLAASIYTSRAKLRTVIFEKETLGGQPMNTELIENYPGFEEGISGAELGSRMFSQATKFGTALEFADVEGIRVNPDRTLTVVAATGEFTGRTLLNAGGAKHRKLGVPGEEDFIHKGIIYCAFCDGSQLAGREVAVAGGGDSGITEAMLLSRLAKKVTVLELLPQLIASKILQERAACDPGIEIRCGVRIEGVSGDDRVKALHLCDVETGGKSVLEVGGLLVSIGREPNTAYLGKAVALDQGGQILVNEYMETDVQGVFAAGDVRSKSQRQIATAVGDGVNAGLSIIRYLQRLGTCS
jgi:thioredoxin reductase (NADPH)